LLAALAAKGWGRRSLKHAKSLMSGIFVYAKNLGALDGINPVRDTLLPKKAAPPPETHATTPEEALAMLDAIVQSRRFGRAGTRSGTGRNRVNVLCWAAARRSSGPPVGRLRGQQTECPPQRMANTHDFTKDRSGLRSPSPQLNRCGSCSQS
jgi:integrase